MERFFSCLFGKIWVLKLIQIIKKNKKPKKQTNPKFVVYVSPGRNVALRQPTIQKSTLHSWHPEKAVDGDVDIPNDTLSQRQTCTHTEPGDKGWWQVSFAKPVYIYQISLHNRRNPDRSGKLAVGWVTEFIVTLV